jgi:hypothetical protein
VNLVIGKDDIPTYFQYITDKRGSPDPSLSNSLEINQIVHISWHGKKKSSKFREKKGVCLSLSINKDILLR